MDLPFDTTFNNNNNQFSTQDHETHDFQFPTNNFTQISHQNNIELIPLTLQVPLDNNDNPFVQIPSFLEDDLPVSKPESEVTRKRKRKTPNSLLVDHDTKNKKIVHREIERQRRSEMSSLHSSLRSLLPLEYLEGKRAMSDHLGEAVKYIEHLQKNIKALNNQRDNLKTEVLCINENNHISKSSNREVKVVKWCKEGGMDVNVTTNYDEGIPLSKVLQCLIQEGFDVVSCISHRVDDSKLLHCIQIQIEDGKIIAIDATKLKQKLEDL